jgi:hypothetical protein
MLIVAKPIHLDLELAPEPRVSGFDYGLQPAHCRLKHSRGLVQRDVRLSDGQIPWRHDDVFDRVLMAQHSFEQGLRCRPTACDHVSSEEIEQRQEVILARWDDI